MKKVTLSLILLSAVAIAATAVTKLLLDSKAEAATYTSTAELNTVSQTIAVTAIDRIDVQFCNVQYTVTDAEVSAVLRAPEDIMSTYNITAKNGKLSIELKPNGRRSNNGNDRATLILKAPVLKEIEARAASAINVLTPLSGDNKLEVELSGASSFAASTVQCPVFSAEASGASAIKIADLTALKTDLEASGASAAVIDKISCKDTECEASGASHITISTGDAGTIDLDASGASSIVCKATVAGGTAEASGASSIKCPLNRVVKEATGMSSVTEP